MREGKCEHGYKDGEYCIQCDRPEYIKALQAENAKLKEEDDKTLEVLTRSRLQVAELRKENSKLKDFIDILCDEFQRIKIISVSSSRLQEYRDRRTTEAMRQIVELKAKLEGAEKALAKSRKDILDYETMRILSGSKEYRYLKNQMANFMEDILSDNEKVLSTLREKGIK